MINLTSAQMAIVKDDESIKTFTVHFPNGERADLSNSDIVYESVTFKESVCSDQSFRFGSADASCIEFETVGVGNIIGLTIECSMTFTLGNEAVTVPYGTFIVDSCPRDHASMVHRKVTAYSTSAFSKSRGNFEEQKDKMWGASKTYDPSFSRMMNCILNEHDIDVDEDLTLIDSTFIPGDTAQFRDENGVYHYLNFSIKEALDDPVQARILVGRKAYRFLYNGTISDAFDKNSRVVARLNVNDYSAMKTDIKQFFDYLRTKDNRYKLFSGTKIGSLEKRLTSIQVEYKISSFANEGIYLPIDDFSGIEDGDYGIADGTDFFESELLYPYRKIDGDDLTGTMRYIELDVPVAFEKRYITVTESVSGERVDEQSFVLGPYTIFDEQNIHVFTFEDSETSNWFRLNLPPTLQQTSAVGSENVGYAFINSIPVTDLLKSYAELNAGFLRENRNGGFEFVRLDNSSPYELTASDVEDSAWWDEYVIKPVGTITYSIGTESGYEYVFDENSQSVYDFTKNAVVSSLMLPEVTKISSSGEMTNTKLVYLYTATSGDYQKDHWYYWSESDSSWKDGGLYQIQEFAQKIFDDFFIPYVHTVDFVPLEATFRGMPYLQCGDAITLTAADGTVINSYILNQSFGGIQHISQDVETVQGTVIGSEIVY